MILITRITFSYSIPST